jgi:hypothetical protein
MGHDAKHLREAAAHLVEECGPYATMAALFLASESQESGEPDGALHWARVAHLIPEITGDPAPGILLACGVAGSA